MTWITKVTELRAFDSKTDAEDYLVKVAYIADESSCHVVTDLEWCESDECCVVADLELP